MLKRLVATCMAGILAASAAISDANAGDFEDGVSAYRSGEIRTAFEIWLPLADAGDVLAQFNIGIMLDRGLGVEPDQEAAVDWLTRAAEQGDAIAAYNLGVIFAEGRGVAQDHAAAAQWYAFAAERDHASAMTNLSFLYARGDGVPQDLGRAAHLIELAEETECLVGETAANHEPRMSALPGLVGGG